MFWFKLISLIFCINEVKSWNYDEELLKVMDEDKVTLIKREIVGSGDDNTTTDDDNSNGHEIGSGDIGAAEIMAVIVCCIIALSIITFIGACTWNKAKTYYKSRNSFSYLQTEAENHDESMLYMVDYDELNNQHIKATLTIDIGKNDMV